MKKKNQSNVLARECIVTALIQLTEQKPFSAITISELTERAGVSRMTYYRNYSSKEEVFQSHMDEIVASYCLEVNKNGAPATFGEYESLYQCFLYFERYRDFVTCLINIGMGDLLLDALSTYLLSTFCPEGLENPVLYYTLQAYAGALVFVYVSWLKNGAKEPIEIMIRIISGQVKVHRDKLETAQAIARE